MSDLLAEAQRVSVVRGQRHVLHHVDLKVSRGEIVTVIGPNGAGKTTLLKVLMGLERPSEGKVTRAPGLRLGYVPQHLSLDRTLPLTVARFLATAGVSDRREAAAMLDRVGAGSLLDLQMADLSGGEKQRATVARALLRRPDLLVLDEPTQGVDVAGEIDLYALVSGIRAEWPCGVLMVSHDLHLVMRETDRVLCLNGHVCCTGKPDIVSADPEYLKLFGPAAAPGLAVYAHHHDHIHAPDGTPVPLPKDDGSPVAMPRRDDVTA